ncbi:hypothetical protein V8D89_001629 [Ganoderma adspersum]
MQLSLSTAVITLATLTGTVVGETHTVHFENFCGRGLPLLIHGQNILSQGDDYTSTGPLFTAIAYLQTDECGFNGENCTLLETDLENLTPRNSGSLTDISLIPPHVFSVPTGFYYFGGCDGIGVTCDSPDCPAATSPQAALCQEDNFLTHGGHNSVIESISAGVTTSATPHRIFWPFFGNRPLSAIHCTEHLEIGYELIEVRSGRHGLKPIYRARAAPLATVDAIRADARGVLQNEFVEHGARKGERLVEKRRAVSGQWDNSEGGAASRRDAVMFLDSL